MTQEDMVVINANIVISGSTLQKIVHTGKQLAGSDAKGQYRLDTADLVADLISQFLLDREFDAYVGNSAHYAKLMAGR